MTKSIWNRRPSLEELARMSGGTAIERLGIEFTAVRDDGIDARMPVDARTLQPLGLLHGGASALLAETLGSAAAHFCVDPGVAFSVGVDLHANHVRAVRAGWVHGSVQPIHLGRTIQLWEIRIVDDGGRLVAVARLTTSTLKRERDG